MNFCDLNDDLVKQIMTHANIATINNFSACNKHYHEMFHDYLSKARKGRKQIVTKYYFRDEVIYFEFHGLGTSKLRDLVEKHLKPTLDELLPQYVFKRVEFIMITMNYFHNVLSLPILDYACSFYDIKKAQEVVAVMVQTVQEALRKALDVVRYDVLPIKYKGKKLKREMLCDRDRAWRKHFNFIMQTARKLNAVSSAIDRFMKLKNINPNEYHKNKRILPLNVSFLYENLPSL